jgi:hypothetical protein
MELKSSIPHMKTNRILRVHPAAAAMLQHPLLGDALIGFLVDLERNPGTKDRSLLFDDGFRRIEATHIGEVCIGYDLCFRSALIYPTLLPDYAREILVWEIAPQGCFRKRLEHRARRAAILNWLLP